MTNIEIPIGVIDKNNFQLDIDLNCYAHEAIVATIYKYTDKYYIFQKQINDNSVRVIFESKDNHLIDEIFVKKFCNDLIDQQVRYNINKQFGHIRDLIVEEAFKPVVQK